MPLTAALAAESDTVCWICDVTIIELLGQQALHVLMAPEAGLGESLLLPLVYFQFLEQALAGPEPACGWVAEGVGITSAVLWPALGERRSINQLHSLHFEYEMQSILASAQHLSPQ